MVDQESPEGNIMSVHWYYLQGMLYLPFGFQAQFWVVMATQSGMWRLSSCHNGEREEKGKMEFPLPHRCPTCTYKK